MNGLILWIMGEEEEWGELTQVTWPILHTSHQSTELDMNLREVFTITEKAHSIVSQ